MGQWQVYVDDVSGRKFYVHAETNERTWKPPRMFQSNRDSKAGMLDPQKSTSSSVVLAELQSPCHANTGAVQMRKKSVISNTDRINQTKSMILTDSGQGLKPISRHRRNHSQHSLSEITAAAGKQSYVEKEGYLNKTKIAEGGKKLRKNWNTVWVVLDGGKLEFYKESKAAALANIKPGYKPDTTDLSGAHIEWTNEKSSRKNVFQITTVSGNEILLQSDIDTIIYDWYQAIREVVDKLPKQHCKSGGQRVLSIHSSASTELLDKYVDENKEAKDSKKSLLFRLNYSASENNERNRVKSRLKKFISRRPSLQTLQEKGLIKEQVFGCPLEILCQREGDTVPQIVKLCVAAVEKRGLDADGIYRVSGNLSIIQKLRFAVDHEEKLNLDDSQWEDIHVVTGALKMFFRELPEPLFPYRFFEHFVEAIKMQDYGARVQSFKNLLKKLPLSSHDTMKILFRHLRKVAAKSDVNLMTMQSLGIVFGPTLMRPEKETGNMAVYMIYQNQIIELFLTEYPEIFGHNVD
ncbi:rho GTPase-activating protein 15 [Protopterus annectens]|uniref:rho GTPase-activating protein 15 n=1 Tax=Protopterus annectens TaxID=7888 RepID=UPI001CFBCB0E|nr:rho GTPase-activating protein 15 [Protopterus annectens]